MKAVALGTVSFVVFAAGPALLFPLLALYPQAQTRPDWFGDFLLAAYLIAISTGFRAIGFVIPIALSRSWRRQTTRRAVVVSGVLGLVSPVVGLAVLMLVAGLITPLFHSVAWLAMAVMYGAPGLALGGI